MNIEKIKKILGFPLEKKYEKNVNQDLCNYISHTGKIFCVAIMIFQIIMMISISNRDGGPFATIRRQSYFYMYISLFCASLISICLISYFKKKNKSCAFYLNTWIIYMAFICLWGCCITLLDQLGGNDLSVFSYIVLTVATFSVFKLWQSILVFGSCFLFINTLLPYIQTIPGNIFSNIVNTLSITLLAAFISTLLYRNRVFTYYDKMLIHSQYEELRRVNKLLNHMVMTDDLTKMNNRRYLEDVIQKNINTYNTEKTVTGMMLDIDYFKQFNDTYGHQEGDYCLKKISNILLDFVNTEDANAVRYGGEEFFICVFNCDEKSAIKKAEYLRQSVENCNLEHKNSPFRYVTISIGLYTKQAEESITLEKFIGYCDEALYTAKKQGRNRVVFFQ